MPCSMDGGVDDVAGQVDLMLALFEDVAVHVHLDQVRSCDLFVSQAVLIDEKLVVCAGNTSGDVIVDEGRHIEVVGQPVGSRQVHANLPLGIRISLGTP